MPSPLASVSPADRLANTLDLIDILREDKETLAAITDTRAEDARLEQGVREMLIAQGLPVDDATIAQAIAQSRQARDLPFTPMSQGMLRTVYGWYVARSKWLPQVVIASVFVVMGYAMWLGIGAWSAARLEGDWRELATQETALSNQIATSSARISALDAYPSLRQRAEGFLAQATQKAASLHSDVPRKGDRQVLATRQKDMETAKVSMAKFDEVASTVASLESLKTRAAALGKRAKPSSWAQLNAAREAELVAFGRAMDQADVQAAERSLGALSQMQTAHADRDILLAAKASVGSAGQEDAARMVAAGEAALLRGDRQGWAQANEAVGALAEQIRQAYTLRVINDSREKSGVWRHPHGNDSDSARNFYLVVDALDALGNPVKVRIKNEETNASVEASRFAVRVPEAVYEKVKADKLDNGIVDDTAVGQKVSGEINPRFTIPVAGGFITSW